MGEEEMQWAAEVSELMFKIWEHEDVEMAINSSCLALAVLCGEALELSELKTLELSNLIKRTIVGMNPEIAEINSRES